MADTEEAAERLRQIQDGIRNGTVRIELPATATPENMPRPGGAADRYDVTAIEIVTFAHPAAIGIVIRYGIRAFGFGELAIAVRTAGPGAAMSVDTEQLAPEAIAAILQAAAPELARLLIAQEETQREEGGEV